MKASLTLSLLLTVSLPALAFVAIEQDRSLPIADIDLVFEPGAFQDPPGKEGTTALMAALLQRGTKAKSKNQIDIGFDQLGSGFSSSTSHYSVLFSVSFLSNKGNQSKALVKEILCEPSFPATEFQKLKNEVLSQLLDELSSDRSVAGKFFRRQSLMEHPLGRDVFGTTQSIPKIQLADLKEAYSKLIRRENLSVLGTGDLDHSLAEDFLNEIRACLPEGAPAPFTNPTQITPARTVQIVDKPDRTQAQILIGHAGLAAFTDADYFSLLVANQAFGGSSFDTRLMQEIRVQRGWSYGASSRASTSAIPEYWQIYTFPTLQNLKATLEHLKKMVGDLEAKGITAEEFEFVKKSLINSDGFRYDTAQKRTQNRLLEHLYRLPDGFFAQYRKNISRLSLEDVNKALKRNLDPSSLWLTVLGPKKLILNDVASGWGVEPKQIKTVDYRAP